MDFTFTPRQRELSERARAFVDEVLIPLEEITDEHGELPMDLREALRTSTADQSP